ncbi:hypothetical protein GCM10009610_05250 [Pseudonocardia xinjiangensis]
MRWPAACRGVSGATGGAEVTGAADATGVAEATGRAELSAAFADPLVAPHAVAPHIMRGRIPAYHQDRRKCRTRFPAFLVCIDNERREV